MMFFLFLACQTSEPEAPKERILVVPGVEEEDVLEPEVEEQSNRPPLIHPNLPTLLQNLVTK